MVLCILSTTTAEKSALSSGGGVIRREDWRVWPEAPPRPEDVRRGRNGEFLVELPPVSFVLVSCDTAYSEKEWCSGFGPAAGRKSSGLRLGIAAVGARSTSKKKPSDWQTARNRPV